jgi:ATP-dependent protease ClpP protease subunit
MAKSKVRGGAKAHRQKVQSRNQKIGAAQSAMQKLFNESMKKQLEEIKKMTESGATESFE